MQDKETYKMKQDWLDAVMVSDMTASTKIFAYGVFRHMYGVRTECYPGTDALQAATHLHPSKYAEYRRELIKRGYLSGNKKDGKVYHYRLTTPTQWVMDLDPSGNDPYPMGNGPLPNGSMNTIRKTSKNLPSEYINETTTEDREEAVPSSISLSKHTSASPIEETSKRPDYPSGNEVKTDSERAIRERRLAEHIAQRQPVEGEW